MTENTMTTAKIINELYQSQFVEMYARKFMGAADRVWHDDIIQELWLMICEVDSDVLCESYNKGGMNSIRAYVSGIIVKQLRSDNSKVYRKYTRHVYREQAVNDFCNWHDVFSCDAVMWDDSPRSIT